VHLLVLETADKMWLDQESAGGQTNVEKCTSVHQRVQGFKAEQMSAPVGPRDYRQDVVGPSREVHLCAPECGNVLPLDEESAGDQSGAQECTCRHQRLQKRCGWAKRVQEVGPMWRSARPCPREW
jgi:hypothetical protein